MMHSSEWQPTEEDLNWTTKVLEGLQEGQDWMEGEMAFRKTGEKTLKLLTRTERAALALARVTTILDKLDWKLNQDDAKIIPDDPMAAAEAIQKEAQSWVCPACKEIHVVDMDLDDVRWSEMGSTVYINEEGDTSEQDRWVISVTCACKETLYLSPDDYYLVAGDRNFYRWIYEHDGKVWVAQALSNEEIIERVDETEPALIFKYGNDKHLGTTFQGNTVPPHMRGTYCTFSRMSAREEEE